MPVMPLASRQQRLPATGHRWSGSTVAKIQEFRTKIRCLKLNGFFVAEIRC
jgi:hypothetical protein